MAPNDFVRNRFLQYNLLDNLLDNFPLVNLFVEEDEVEEEAAEDLDIPLELEKHVTIAQNVEMRLNMLPPDYERYMIIQAESYLNHRELFFYQDPQPSNLSAEEVQTSINNFIATGLALRNEAIANRQSIEASLRELLLFYSEGQAPPQHGVFANG